MRWFRLGAIGVSSTAILTAIQGCTLKDAGLFFLVLFALMLPNLGDADNSNSINSNSVEVIDQGKTDIKGEVHINLMGDIETDATTDLTIRVTNPSGNPLMGVEVLLTSYQNQLLLMALDLSGNYLPHFWTGSRLELSAVQYERAINPIPKAISMEITVE